jgi:signal transduction histidine kinase
VFGSAALFFVNSETIYASSLAIFLLAFGGMMVSTALVLKHAIRSAVTQGLRAEAISQDLARALAETQAERDSRTRFIAAASHDLRQPLQAASLFFAQLQRSDDPERRERARRGVERGLAEAMVMLEAMSEHLRLESGSLEAHCQPVDLAAIFASLALELGPAAQRAGIDLRASRPRVSVLADPVLLTRILRNLLTNALLHSRGRHVRLLARRRALVEIIVIDDGVGISPEEAETLFLPYTQGAGAHRLGHGSGLGLAIAREMAHLMDARLVLEPRWRGGCAFVLALPAASPPQAGPEDRATPPADAPLAARTILLVEDRADIREAIAASLSRRGIKVAQFATSDAVAAALAEGLRPSAVITDWHLGAEDSGVRVVALVREHAPGAGIVVISGDATATATSEIARSGCRLLLKPVSETDLLEALRAVSSVPG